MTLNILWYHNSKGFAIIGHARFCPSTVGIHDLDFQRTATASLLALSCDQRPTLAIRPRQAPSPIAPASRVKVIPGDLGWLSG